MASLPAQSADPRIHTSPPGFHHSGHAALLLDTGSLRDWIQSQIQWPADTVVRQVRLHRTWATREGALRFELAIQLQTNGSGGVYLLQGGTGSPQGRVRAPRRRVRIRGQWLLGIRLHDARRSVWLHSPDRDTRLKAVRGLLRVPQLARILRGTATAAYLGCDSACTGLKPTLEAYRATRRCVVRIQSPRSGRTVYAKVMRRPVGSGQVHLLRRLATFLDHRSCGRLRLAPVLDLLGDARVQITAGIGPPAAPLTPGARESTGLAAALACLHGAPLAAPVVHSPPAEFRTVSRWSRVLREAARPQVDDPWFRRWSSLLTELEAQRLDVAEEGFVLIHRDLHPAQFLRDGETTWILDLDSLSSGHPEVDVATWFAHALFDHLRLHHADEAHVSAVEDFIRAYTGCGGSLSPARWPFYLGAALLRISAIHRLRSGCAASAETVLQHAARCLSVRQP